MYDSRRLEPFPRWFLFYLQRHALKLDPAKMSTIITTTTTTTDKTHGEVAQKGSEHIESATGADGADTPQVQPIRVVLWESRKIVMFSILCCVGSMLWGFDIGVNTISTALPAFKLVFGYEYDGELVLSATWNALWTAMGFVGMLIGGIVCGLLSDRWGRKMGMLAGSVMSAIGVAVEYISASPGVLLVGKILNGFALGFFLSIGPIYVSEIAPVRLRAPLIATTNFFISAGQMTSIGIGNTRYAIMTPSAYKVIFAAQWAFPAAIILLLVFMPESPRYLVRQGKIQAAEKSLRTLYPSGHDIQQPLAMIQEDVHAEELSTLQQSGQRFIDCFRGTDWRRTRIACGMFLIQQFTGIAFYSQSLYFLGISGFNIGLSFKLALAGFGAGLVGNVLAWFAMSHFGRRSMLFSGTLINLSVLLSVGVAGIFSAHHSAMLYIAIMINFIQLVYAPTVGAVSWSLSGEVSSPKLRAKTQGLCTLTNAVANWVFNFITPYLINTDEANLGAKAAFVWAALTAIGAVWVWLEVPEVKDLSFAELDQAFAIRMPTRQFPSPGSSQPPIAKALNVTEA